MRDAETLKSTLNELLAKAVESVSVIDLVDVIIEYAYVARASDVHLEPGEDGVAYPFQDRRLAPRCYRAAPCFFGASS